MSIFPLLRRQYGVASRTQLRELGLTRHQIDGLLKTGVMTAVHRGVYRHAALPSTWRARALAATLASGGVASHRCAARLWGLEGVPSAPIEVTIPSQRRSQRLGGVRVHRSTQWFAIDRTERHGIPCTGVDRTLLDCAAVVSAVELERVCESAIRQELTGWQSLATVLECHAASGRNGVGAMRALLTRRLNDQTVPRSEFSRRVVDIVTRRGIEAPQLEYPIHSGDGRLLLLADLAWPRSLKAIELDGMRYHFGRAERERDVERRAVVRAEGWRLLELSWRLCHAEPSRAADLIAGFLRD